jgi:ribosome maturation factor RimP
MEAGANQLRPAHYAPRGEDMKSRFAKVVREITELIEPVLDEMGIELVDAQYLSERGRWILRIYVDQAGGIGVDECAEVSREIGDLIDVRDIIGHEYVLEVSSPGLDRPLTRDAHFLGAVGKKVKVRMQSPIEGRRNFTGRLRRFENRTLYLEAEKGVIPLSLENVEKANLVYEFQN